VLCVAVTALFTVKLKLAVAVAPIASVTVTAYVAAVLAALAVPVMAPVLKEKLRPAGSAGEMLYASGAVPPVPVTGVKAVTAWFFVSTADETLCCAATESYVYQSAVTVALVPAAVTTTISTTPAIPAGAVAVMLVSLRTVKTPAGTLPNITAEAPVKPVPVIVTLVPPARGPRLGLVAVTTGA
jgi:hypothetical protein